MAADIDVSGVGTQLKNFGPGTNLQAFNGIYMEQNGQEVRTTLATLLSYVIENGPGVILTIGVPGVGVGVPGQLALDFQNGVVYGPMTSAGWGAGVEFGSNTVVAAVSAVIGGSAPVLTTLLATDVIPIIRNGELFQTTLATYLNFVESPYNAGELSQASQASRALTIAIG